MNPFRSLGRAMADLAIAARNALYTVIDAWRDTFDEMPDIPPLTPEEYRAISSMLDSLDSGDTLDLTPEEFAAMHAGLGDYTSWPPYADQP